MGDNPDDPATTDIEFGDAAHAGSPPVHWRIEILTPRDKDIARVSRKRHRVDLNDLERVFQLRAADKSDITGLSFRKLMDVVFIDLEFDKQVFMARHLKKDIAFADRRAPQFFQVALDNDSFIGELTWAWFKRCRINSSWAWA